MLCKFCFVCLLLYFNICHIGAQSTTRRLFKRQTLIENKKNIGEGEETWALVGNIPTPTLGRITPSEQPEQYMTQIGNRNRGNRREDTSRLKKRWVRDGNIDRESRRSPQMQDETNWQERESIRNRERNSGSNYRNSEWNPDNYRNIQRNSGNNYGNRERNSENYGNREVNRENYRNRERNTEDNYRGQTYGTRDGEGRRYKRSPLKSLQDYTLPQLQQQQGDFKTHHDNRYKYDRYGGGNFGNYPQYGGRGYGGGGREYYPGRGYGNQDYERTEEKIIITNRDITAEKPYY